MPNFFSPVKITPRVNSLLVQDGKNLEQVLIVGESSADGLNQIVGRQKFYEGKH
jgi:hypothetical protein